MILICNVTEDPQRSKFGFGLVSIYRHNENLWTGYYKNVITLRISYDEIIDFAYRHRKEISQNIRKLKHDVINNNTTELDREYARRLKLAYDRTGDERAKALLEVGYWDEDDVCNLLAELEKGDGTTAVIVVASSCYIKNVMVLCKVH